MWAVCCMGRDLNENGTNERTRQAVKLYKLMGVYNQ